MYRFQNHQFLLMSYEFLKDFPAQSAPYLLLLFVIILAVLFCNFCKWLFQLHHSSPTRNSNNENEVQQFLRIVYLRLLKVGYI